METRTQEKIKTSAEIRFEDKLWSRLWEARDIKLWIGAVYDIYGRAAMFVSITNFIMLALVFYVSVIEPEERLDWLTIPVFIFVVIALGLLFILFAWKILIPSLQAYINWREYIHGNLIRRDLEEIKRLLMENRR